MTPRYENHRPLPRTPSDRLAGGAPTNFLVQGAKAAACAANPAEIPRATAATTKPVESLLPYKDGPLKREAQEEGTASAMNKFQAASLSRSEVNRAGDVLRALQLRDPAAGDNPFWAYQTLIDFRAAHQYPLIKATVGLRSMVSTAGCKVEVTQRLKRIPTILNKLVREPKMELGRMQDIGGCRAVLDSIGEVQSVERRIQKAMIRRSGHAARSKDYINSPRESGYRGVHVIVQYDGMNVEVQLRTQVMHQWAIAVERLSWRMSDDLKSGTGPREIIDWLRAVSMAMAIEETGGTVSQAALADLNGLRETALAYIGGDRR